MGKPVEELKKITREYQLLAESAAILAWDQETYIPPRAVPERGEQLALLQSLAHERLTSQKVGDLLAACGCSDGHPAGDGGPDSPDGPYLRELYRRYTREVRIPSSLVSAMARAASAGQAAWAEARSKDDFALFQPRLEELVSLTVEKAQAVGFEEHPYDALIDEFEPWMKTARVSEIFQDLEASLSDLAARIAERPQVDDGFLYRPFDLQKQREFSRRIVGDLGYDFEQGRIDETAHPFTTTLGGNDVRITGRFREDYLGTGLFGLIHECGHALYEQGFSGDIHGNILATGTSLGIHESQSRTWENAIGRGRPFWQRYLPVAQEYFPDSLAGVGINEFYRGVNKVSPTFIRIDADEVTYGLHIILRFKLELALVTGDLAVADLPAAWRELSVRLLGIEPAKASEGELQDIHWSMGAIGYFPTYALGNLYGAQFYAAMKKSLGNLEELIAAGEFAPIVHWLRTNIHRFGASKSADEICHSATGEALKADYFMNYLTAKFGEIYGL